MRPENPIQSIDINVYEFSIDQYRVFTILQSTQVQEMRLFFDRLSTGNWTWESAKKEAVKGLLKIEYNSHDIDKLEMLYYNTSTFSNIKEIFNKIEFNGKTHNVIREIKINKTID